MLTLLSAAEFEMRPTLQALGRLGIEAQGVECGIGPLNCAMSFSRTLEQVKGRDVVFIGTCGSLGAFSGIELITSRAAIWAPVAVRLGAADLIEDLHPPIHLPKTTSAFDLPHRMVVTSPCISRTSAMTDSCHALAKEYGGAVENLEAYVIFGVADHCRSFSTVLAVTNKVGPEGRIEWRRNFREAAELTAAYIANAYGAGDGYA